MPPQYIPGPQAAVWALVRDAIDNMIGKKNMPKGTVSGQTKDKNPHTREIDAKF